MPWELFKKFAGDRKKNSEPVNIASEVLLPLELLRKLIPIGDLPAEKLRALNVNIRKFESGEAIFNRGDRTDEIPYIMSGEVFLETQGGHGYYVDTSTFKSCYPLSMGGEYKFSAFAKTAASIIYVPLHVFNDNRGQIADPLLDPENVPLRLRNSRFFNGFCSAYGKNQIRIPSLPDVALRLRAAMQRDISISEAVKIINLDSVISSKLIQVVNSPIYRSVNPIASCFEAVNRLGLKTSQNLVTSISLHNLFISKDRHLHEKIRAVWKQSIHVASLGYALAIITKQFNPDEVLLAGLIHNIGALPVITFAEGCPRDAYTEQELRQTIAVLQSPLGASILKNWGFPLVLQQIPMQVFNWYYDNGHDLQLYDLVLLAKFHSQFGGDGLRELPPLYTLPAFLKLGDMALTPDVSLRALHEAKQQIAEALSFFRD